MASIGCQSRAAAVPSCAKCSRVSQGLKIGRHDEHINIANIAAIFGRPTGVRTKQNSPVNAERSSGYRTTTSSTA